tara:strand:+ start:947 stop:2278 length:1332 start_codon:yes stop_codon:yes gene_type:complete
MAKSGYYSKGAEIKVFNVMNPNGSVTHDMKTLLGPISVYEDLTDASIHINVTILDTFGKKEHVPIRSGSKVELFIETPSGDIDFTDYPLYISNIVASGSTEKKDVYVLELETVGMFNNNLTRLYQKYNGKADVLIAQFLKQLGVPDFWAKTENLEKPKYPIQFMGNYKRILQTCISLATKSLPVIEGGTGTDTSNEGSGGFFFWETIKGYYFKSIDNLFKAAKELKRTGKVPKYFQSSTMDALDMRNNFRIVSQPSWSTNHNLLQKLMSGQYASFNTFVDLNGNVHTIPVRDAKASQQFQPTYDEDGAVLANEVTHNPEEFLKESRIMLSVIDSRTFDAGEEFDADSTGKTNQEHVLYKSRIQSRYASLFSEVLTITVPMNVGLSAGSVVEVEFPRLNIDEPNSGHVNPASGLYMIKSLSHQLLAEGDYTGLKLVRDSYSELS